MMRIDSMIVVFWVVPVVMQIVLPLGMLLGFGVKRMFAGKVGKKPATVGGETKRLRPRGTA